MKVFLLIQKRNDLNIYSTVTSNIEDFRVDWYGVFLYFVFVVLHHNTNNIFIYFYTCSSHSRWIITQIKKEQCFLIKK